MLNFYTFPEAVRVMFSILTILSAGFAALVLVLHQHRFRRELTYWLNSAAAFLVLCQTFINVALIAVVQFNITDGFIVPSGYIIARYAVFVATTAIFVILLIKEKSFLPGVAFITSFLTLPVMEAWTGDAFPAVFSTAILIILANGIWFAVKIRKELLTSISGLSVKQAMDSLDAAILFYRNDGHILMQNSRMQELMIKTAGRVLYNGKRYLETTVIPNSENAGTDSYFYRFRASGADNVWLFTVKEIMSGAKRVTRITAADITEQDKAAALLKDRHIELEMRREQLKALVDNIEETCRSENLLRLKTNLHDAHNTKLTTLLQYLRYGQLPEDESFDTLSKSALYDLKETKPVLADPKAELSAITGQYRRKGVEIQVTGDLPPEHDFAMTFVRILQEAAANAVLHGYAGEITVWLMFGDGKYTMRVTDNGARIITSVKEGSGITGMRQRAEAFGGKLYIETSPRFTLTAMIPAKEGEKHE